MVSVVEDAAHEVFACLVEAFERRDLLMRRHAQPDCLNAVDKEGRPVIEANRCLLPVARDQGAPRMPAARLVRQTL